MNSRERIKALIAGETADRCGFWLGNPHADTWPILHKYFGTNTEEALRQKLRDDFRWISPQFFPNAYQDPDGKRMKRENLCKWYNAKSVPFASLKPWQQRSIRSLSHTSSPLYSLLKRGYRDSPFSSHGRPHLMSPGRSVYQLVMEPSSLQNSGRRLGS